MSLMKPFVRSRSEVAEWLERVLSGTLDCRAWDSFVRVPIKGDPEMDAIRVECEALEPHETIAHDGTIRHTPKAREALQTLLKRLRIDG